MTKIVEIIANSGLVFAFMENIPTKCQSGSQTWLCMRIAPFFTIVRKTAFVEPKTAAAPRTLDVCVFLAQLPGKIVHLATNQLERAKQIV